jgi:hypothetical protein
MGKKHKTLAACTTSFLYYSESCHKIRAKSIDRATHLSLPRLSPLRQGMAPGTCWSKFSNVQTFLQVSGRHQTGQERRTGP